MDSAPSSPGRDWAKPGVVLALFCTVNFIVYCDRGIISSNGVNGARSVDGKPGHGIQGDFELTLAQDGMLPAAFMVGLLGSSPIFAEASKHHNAFRLIAVGLAVWTVAAAGCGFAVGFVSLLICRMAVGVGEASFVALASPFIDDKAPPARKSRWLAMFYMCIPVGYAAGYILGGVLAGPLGWRAVFWLEAAVMLPILLFCCLAPPIDLHGKHAGQEEGPQAKGSGMTISGTVAAFGQDFVVLCRHPVYVCTVAGCTIYTGVIGAYAFMGPKAGRDTFNVSGEAADLTFGAVTVATGILGTVTGGVLLDYIGSTMRNALLICCTCVLIGCFFVLLGFDVARTLLQFVPPFAMGELALFAIQAPSNAVALWSVPPALRPFGMSVLIVMDHLLGDVPSPVLLGWLQEIVSSWRISMGVCTAFLVLSAVFFFAGMHIAPGQPDYRMEQAGQTVEEACLDDEDAESSLLASSGSQSLRD